MVKTKKEPQTDSADGPRACLLCQKKYKNVVELCTYCKKQLTSASGPNASIIDRGLIEAFTQKRAVDKANCVKKLARATSTDFQHLEATIASLRKEKKALRDRLRRAPARRPTKAKLGFKQKTEKSAPQTGPRPSQGQTAAIKKSKLKSY